ncbi:hypothetical protein HUK65_18170, partial [Rhodobacteraceae bacterium 2376]|nr:hypothetical protein [Rhabdonatronobacter sediminivivens]
RIVAALGDEAAQALQVTLDATSLAMASAEQEGRDGTVDLDSDDRSGQE